MTTSQQIEQLEKRLEMAEYQRKITTQLHTVWEYDQEISKIKSQIEQLQHKLILSRQ